jgi:hypothetical protein
MVLCSRTTNGTNGTTDIGRLRKKENVAGSLSLLAHQPKKIWRRGSVLY